MANEGTALCKRLGAAFTFVWTLDRVYCLMYAQALTLLKCFATVSALIISHVCVDLDRQKQQAICLNNSNNRLLAVLVIKTLQQHICIFKITDGKILFSADNQIGQIYADNRKFG